MPKSSCMTAVSLSSKRGDRRRSALGVFELLSGVAELTTKLQSQIFSIPGEPSQMKVGKATSIYSIPEILTTGAGFNAQMWNDSDSVKNSW